MVGLGRGEAREGGCLLDALELLTLHCFWKQEGCSCFRFVAQLWEAAALLVCFPPATFGSGESRSQQPDVKGLCSNWLCDQMVSWLNRLTLG